MNKPVILALLAAFTLPLAASARLGETPEQVEARYGKGEDDPECLLAKVYDFCKPVRIYHKLGFKITVLFMGGTSAFEEYVSEDGHAITDAQRDTLLAANQGASAWKQGAGGYWTREDRGARAESFSLAKFQVIDARITARTKEKKDTKALTGF